MTTRIIHTAADFPVGTLFTPKRSSIPYRVVSVGEYGSGRTVYALRADGGQQSTWYFAPANMVPVAEAPAEAPAEARTRIIPADSLPAYAASLVSEDPYAPTLRCGYCAREVDTYAFAHDHAYSAILAFLEHTAYDHTGRADILSYTVRTLGRVELQSEQEYRLASQEPETGTQGVSEHIDAIEASVTDHSHRFEPHSRYPRECRHCRAAASEPGHTNPDRVTDSDRATMEAATEFDA
jgi:hypothetical protein